MYICVCNALKEKEIRQACEGECRISKVFERLDCRPACGKCTHTIKAHLTAQTAAGTAS